MNEITLNAKDIKKHFGGAVLIREQGIIYVPFTEREELSQKGKNHIPLPRFCSIAHFDLAEESASYQEYLIKADKLADVLIENWIQEKPWIIYYPNLSINLS